MRKSTQHLKKSVFGRKRFLLTKDTASIVKGAFARLFRNCFESN